MTLAHALKPAATVTMHAQAKGSQLGACVGVVVALPALSLAPSKFNASDAPPLVAVARISGTVALLGTTAATLACASKLARLTREEIEQRAHKLAHSDDRRVDMMTSVGGAVAGLTLVGVRVNKLAEVEGESFGRVLCSWQSCWDAYCFAAMGAAIGFVTLKGAKMVACKIGFYSGACKEGDTEGDTEVAAPTGEMAAVQQNVQAAVEEMKEGGEAEETHDKAQ